MDAVSTLKAANKNQCARWSFGDITRDEDPRLAVNRVGNGYFLPQFTPKFVLDRSSVIFAIGSCFAREIESALLRGGLKVASRLVELEGNSRFPLRRGVTTIHDFFNRYNVPSIALALKNLSPSSDFQLEQELVFEQDSELFDDLHYTAAALSAPYSVVMERRRWLRSKLSESYAQCDVVVLTLGLSEAWLDQTSGLYLNVISSPQMLRRYSDRLSVRMIDYTEAMHHLKDSLVLLKQDRKRVILTVSPVPLQVTFLDGDVVVANAASKAILRAICEEAARDDPNVDYFPSYEMVTHSAPDLAWKPDGRHVQAPMVEQITGLAMASYFPTTTA